MKNRNLATLIMLSAGAVTSAAASAYFEIKDPVLWAGADASDWMPQQHHAMPQQPMAPTYNVPSVQPPASYSMPQAGQYQAAPVYSRDWTQPLPDTRIHHVGRPGLAEVVEGFGDAVPLEAALDILVPDNWSLHIQDSLDLTTPISWDIGQSWVSALDRGLSESRLHAVLDWGRQHVEIMSRPGQASVSAYPQFPVENVIPPTQAPAPQGYAMPMTPYAMYPSQPVPPAYPQPQNPPLYPQAHPQAYPSYPVAPMGYHGSAYVQHGPMSFDDFMNQQVYADIRGANIQQVLGQLLPPGWVVELVGVNNELKDKRIDYTTPENQARGQALHEVGRFMGVKVTPYVHLSKLVVSEAS